MSRTHNGVPDVYLFRKTADVLLRADRATEETEQYQLLQSDPEKVDRRRDLSIGLLNVGDALAGAQKREEARAAYEQCRTVREELAPKDPR